MIVLVVPPKLRGISTHIAITGIGISYIKEVLIKHNYEVVLLDCNRLGLNVEQAVEKIIDLQPKIVGISVTFLLNDCQATYRLVQELKNKLDIHIILGGHTASIFYKEFLLLSDKIDSIVVGDGEESIVRLIEGIFSGYDCKNIKGIASKNKKGEIFYTPGPAIEDLNLLPFPDSINGVNAYISSSRGCYADCSFCAVKRSQNTNHKHWRFRTPTNVVDEIEDKVAKGVKHITFVDDNFLGPGPKGRARAQKIAEEILNRGIEINFDFECRSNDLDYQTLSILKEAGLKYLYLGFESGVQRALDTFNKGTKVADNIRAANLCKELQVGFNFGFIMYDPLTTLEEIEENLVFLRTIRGGIITPIDHFHYFNRLSLYPNTEICARFNEKEFDLQKFIEDEDTSFLYYKHQNPVVGYIVDVMQEIYPLVNEPFNKIKGHIIQLRKIPGEFRRVCENKDFSDLFCWYNNLGMICHLLLEKLVDKVRGIDRRKVNKDWLKEEGLMILTELNEDLLVRPQDDMLRELELQLGGDQ